MFNDVIIRGFRGISGLRIDDFKQINLFVGKNSSCKTTILESLFLLVNPTAPDLANKVNMFRGLNVVDQEAFEVIFHNFDLEAPIKLSAHMGSKENLRTLKITPKYGDTVGLENQLKTGDNEFIDDRFFQSGAFSSISGLVFETRFMEGENKETHYVSQMYLEATKEGPALRGSGPKDYVEKSTGIYLAPQLFVPQQTASQLSSVLLKKRKEVLINILKSIEPKISDIMIGFGNKIYCDLGFPKMVPMNVLGSGTYKMLSIILGIESTQGGAVFIDEIENGLSPAAIEVMWNAIISSAKDLGVQVFATSHSLECIRALARVSGQRLKDLEDDIRVYRIEKQKENIEAILFNAKDLRTTIEHDWDLR
jgi:AAA15 family ATPase/GTPase